MFALEANYLKILKCCWLLIIFLPTFFAYEDGSLCESTLEFLDCSDEPEERLVISRRIRNTFYVKYIPGDKCKFKEVAYHWGLAFANGSMKLYEEYHKKDYVFVVEPFTLTYHSQPYYLMFVVYEMYKNTKKIGELKAACSFEVSRENPIPIIKGGLEISVDSGKDIVIDGAGSIDLEVPHGLKGHLQFKWSCTVSDDKLSEFCQKNLGKNSMVKIPARYAVHNSIYTFTLSVKSRESDWQSTNQKVNIFTGASSIEIICEKNCPPDVPVSNAKQVTIFEVKCKVNCKNINSNLYKWSINSDFSYESATKFGRQGPVFYIYEKILTEGQTYEVSVEITNEQGEIKGKAARSLTFHESPTLGQCSIEPAQGEALSTLFRVHCSHKKGVYTFEVYSVTEKSETLLARSILLGNIEFVLSAGVHVLVKMIDPYEFNDIQFLTVDVTDTLNPEEKSLDKQLTKRYYDKKSKFSIVNLLANKKYYELMQLLNVFADELEQLSQNANFKKTASLYKNKLLTALQSIPLTDVYLCKQAASIATKISLDEIGHQNPNVAWKATAVCVDAAKKTLDHYNKVQFVGSFAEEISDTGGLFAECTQVGLSTNHDVLKTRHILTTLSTPYPLLKIHAITEHYPDYFDDEGVSRNKMKLERSCQNLISLCALSTELLVTPLSPYQDGSISKYDLLEVIAIKKFGKDLQDFSISSLGTEVQPSKDFLNSKEVEISMCTTETNPFISINKEKIESPIAIIQFRSKKVITSFHHPFTISFKYAVNDSRYITHKGTTLRHTGKTKTKEDGKFEAMTMFQIDVIRNQSYFIVFTEFSQSINIYVTKFYKPTPAEFEDKCTEITEVGKTIFIENTMDYDHWDYLTVVPSTGKAKVNFKFRVFTYSCSSWQVSTRSWTNACGSSNESNSEKIVCKCYHSSVFSGKMKNNPVKEEHTLYTQHKLEVQASFIIFLSVLVLWILYCAFLTYLSFVKEKYKRQDIYFLSDIPSFYRYGYLVIVKTGNTGTTSNVMMKIYGTNTESKEHVLNFPDPDKKILRKGQEDWFFFATQYYLGDIKKIEIWFDSVGYRPSW